MTSLLQGWVRLSSGATVLEMTASLLFSDPKVEAEVGSGSVNASGATVVLQLIVNGVGVRRGVRAGVVVTERGCGRGRAVGVGTGERSCDM